jgi:hypothetical protein
VHHEQFNELLICCLILLDRVGLVMILAPYFVVGF